MPPSRGPLSYAQSHAPRNSSPLSFVGISRLLMTLNKEELADALAREAFDDSEIWHRISHRFDLLPGSQPAASAHGDVPEASLQESRPYPSARYMPYQRPSTPPKIKDISANALELFETEASRPWILRRELNMACMQISLACKHARELETCKAGLDALCTIGHTICAFQDGAFKSYLVEHYSKPNEFNGAIYDVAVQLKQSADAGGPETRTDRDQAWCNLQNLRDTAGLQKLFVPDVENAMCVLQGFAVADPPSGKTNELKNIPERIRDSLNEPWPWEKKTQKRITSDIGLVLVICARGTPTLHDKKVGLDVLCEIGTIICTEEGSYDNGQMVREHFRTHNLVAKTVNHVARLFEEDDDYEGMRREVVGILERLEALKIIADEIGLFPTLKNAIKRLEKI